MAEIPRALPLKSLDQMNQAALKEWGRLMSLYELSLESILDNSNPDPDAYEVMSTIPESMEKSLTDGEREQRAFQEEKDFQRRWKYGAPRRAFGQLTGDTAKELINALGFREGTLTPAPTGIEAEAGEQRTETVPLSRVTGSLQPLRSDQTWKELMEVSRTRPILLTLAGAREYTVISGAEAVLVAAVTHVPALVATTVTSIEGKGQTGEHSPTARSWQDLMEIGKGITKDEAYRLPSLFEPLGQLARKWKRRDFVAAATGGESSRVKAARESMERREREVEDFWKDKRAQALLAGKEPRTEELLKDPVLKKRDQAVAAAQDTWERELRRQEQEQEVYQEAMEKVLELAREDGIDRELDPDPGLLWDHANRGRVGWLSEDARLLLDGESNEILDTSPEMLYIRGRRAITRAIEMNEPINLPEFNVEIPAGSNSWRLERELLQVTEEMNRTSLMVSTEAWQKNLQRLQDEWERTRKACQEEAGDPTFRPNATADCIRALFVEGDWPIQRCQPKTGNPVVDKDTLIILQGMGCELAGLIIQAREARSKLSQLEKWEPYARAGEVQCSWNQFGTPHGRYSCDSPNLQNRVLEVRETIVARPGYEFVSLDLGQAEYVTWASLSGDPTLTAAFEEGKDFHTEMGRMIREAAPDVDLRTQTDRQLGKLINFALLYLMTEFTLAKKLGISIDEARKLIKLYEERAPLAIKYRKDVLAEAKRAGQVRTQFGRTRTLTAVKRATGTKLHELNKTLWHHHNAGTAAEALKIKQVKTWKAIRRRWDEDDVRMVLQMHDEVVLEVRRERTEEVTRLALEKFQEGIKGLLPFAVETRIGASWLEVSK